MRLLKVTEEYRADSEVEAKEAMETFRANAAKEGYQVIKSGYTYKQKKSKGDVVDEAWIVSVTKEYGGIWI